ncbi:sulfur carrier protein ThiS [Salimicrobium sp. PL1-032A]|uniref:sulfur carrier protein ThiS n=1 Tax=Salimicrobium sp. PL1-032A TaxID=3095364 RepID=UPI00326168B2
MKLRINGTWTTLGEEIQTVGELMEHFSLEQKSVVVEQNEEILANGNRDSRVLKDGDIIEIVHFVGGG